MSMPDWVTRLPGAVMVSNANNRIIYMNEAAAKVWEHKGGMKLVGSDLLACHNEHSKAMIHKLLSEGGTNVYTIDKAGVKKLIYQSAWRDEQDKIGGLVELSLVLPDPMPHHVR